MPVSSRSNHKSQASKRSFPVVFVVLLASNRPSGHELGPDDYVLTESGEYVTYQGSVEANFQIITWLLRIIAGENVFFEA